MDPIKKRRIEIVAIILVVVLAIVVASTKIYLDDRAAKEDALLSELKAVRESVKLYFTVNHAYPVSLKTLTTEKYTIGSKNDIYLSGIKMDKEQFPIDSFGYRFNFDPKTGRVLSGNKKYAGW